MILYFLRRSNVRLDDLDRLQTWIQRSRAQAASPAAAHSD